MIVSKKWSGQSKSSRSFHRSLQASLFKFSNTLTVHFNVMILTQTCSSIMTLDICLLTADVSGFEKTY